MPGDSPEASAIATSRQARLLKGVRLLPLAYRQPVMLTLEGMTPKEIAEILGISANAAANRLSRAKEMLRQYMGE
jgi:RNA polymerase sigma-70 factor (ECF subfamily)